MQRTFNAKTPRGQSATKLPDRLIKRRGRKGARKGRKENLSLRSSAPTFASSALNNPFRKRRYWEIAPQSRKAAGGLNSFAGRVGQCHLVNANGLRRERLISLSFLCILASSRLGVESHLN
jgi:hypothetical protein